MSIKNSNNPHNNDRRLSAVDRRLSPIQELLQTEINKSNISNSIIYSLREENSVAGKTIIAEIIVETKTFSFDKVDEMVEVLSQIEKNIFKEKKYHILLMPSIVSEEQYKIITTQIDNFLPYREMIL